MWLEYLRESSPISSLGWMISGLRNKTKQHIGAQWKNLVYYNTKSKLDWLEDSGELERIGRFVVGRLRDQKTRKEHFALYDSLAEGISSYFEKFRRAILENEGDAQLAEMLRQANSLGEEFGGLTMEIDAIDYYLEALLKRAIKQRVKQVEGSAYRESTFSDVLNVLTAPSGLSFVREEEKLVYSAALRKSLGKSIDAELRELEERFWWSRINWGTVVVNDGPHYASAVEAVLKESKGIEGELQKLGDYAGKTKKKKEALFAKYCFDAETVCMLNLCDEFAHYHDVRKKWQMHIVFMKHRLFSEIARRKNRPLGLVKLMWDDEAIALLQNGVFDAAELKKRADYTLVHLRGKELKALSGKEALGYYNNNFVGSIQDVNDFDGMVASLGRVVGRAKIAFSAAEAMQKLNNGDVLVTGMTLPDFVPAMKKAAAVVTDEGGITCHAAIICREFGIPCIVGTKIATKVLKDNDLIEVNANHGIVKKIKG